MSNYNLKPCPLCGGEARLTIDETDLGDVSAVLCDNCNLVLLGRDTAEEENLKLVKKWNGRSNADMVVDSSAIGNFLKSRGIDIWGPRTDRAADVAIRFLSENIAAANIEETVKISIELRNWYELLEKHESKG